MGNGFSLAWRVLDAAGWGVPQRRKRIFLVADFAGERAAEILFNENRLLRHPTQGGEAGQTIAADAQESAGRSCGGGTVQCLNPWSPQGIRQYDVNGISPALQAGENGGQNRSGICYSPAAFMGGQGAKAGSIAYADDGSTPTLKSAPSGGNTVPDVVYPINTMVATRGGADDGRTTFGVGEANDPQFTLGAAHEHAVCYAIEGNGTRESHEGNGYAESDTMYTLNTIDRNAVAFQNSGDRGNPSVSVSDKAYCIPANPMSDRQQAVCFQQNQREEVRDMGGASGALSAEPGSHQQNYVCYKQSGFADYEEGVGTLKASGGDVGGVLKASSSRSTMPGETGTGKPSQL